MTGARRLPFGLRSLLALALLPLVALPLIGLRFVDVMTELARNERLENQAAAARSLAASLHERRELFERDAVIGAATGARPLPVPTLPRIVVDQRGDEWPGSPPTALAAVDAASGAPMRRPVRILAARDGTRPAGMVLMVDADDERLVKPSARDGRVQPGDELIIAFGESPDTMVERRVTPSERAGGWIAEIEFAQTPRLLRLVLADVDYLGSRKVESRADTGLMAPARPEGERAAMLDVAWDNATRAFERASGRVSVFDTSGALLAQRGEPGALADPGHGWTTRAARWLLAAAAALRTRSADDDGDAAASGAAAGAHQPGASADVLARALAGVATQRARPLEAQAGLPRWLLTSAQPIWIGDRVGGALVLEESTEGWLSVGQQALERLTLLATSAVAACALVLMLVGSITVGRIVRLRRQAERAIDARGRVVGTIAPSPIADEIGSLGDSYQRVLQRLQQHQQYLGNLRSRLVHELRTPIMIVRSSLDNLADETDPSRRDEYLQRVADGAHRLERIVASMGEASSLETMLADSRAEPVDLHVLLEGCASGYRAAFPSREFVVDAAVAQARCPVIADAIVQALDKLVANADDFGTIGTPIVLSLASTRDHAAGYRIAVRNQGPALPQAMRDQLFDSMVSVREASGGAQAHLGLGLYLVRLVAEFHGGEAFARDIPKGVEVGFTITAPRGPTS